MANLPETPQWESGIYQIEVSDPVLGGPDGISNRQAKQLASRTSYLKQKVEKSGTDLAAHIAAVDPHTQYATKASPTFTGTPTAPTPANGDNSKKLATTEFVAKALAALAGSAPETLDTLKELADALGNDPNFATTVLNKLAEKLAKDQNGAAFSSEMYPNLAKAYPTNKLPDLRGEFIRGWDDGRGVDAGRALLRLQDDSFEAHRHESFFYAGISRNEIPLKNLPSSDEMLTLSSTTNALSPDGIDATNSLIGNDDYNCLIEGNKNNKRTATGLSTSIVGATETRPRNIAFNYIVRAA
ncbi:tail fiber domain-containing protein [Salmonella enterica subsp. enterica serovar Typhi]|nr:tail fiber domain-containing protein [Salmonella enterica subsp. enterica serovar Typhi]